MKAFDPTREEKVTVSLRGPDGTPAPKEYRLRFGMHELLVAERRLDVKVNTADAASQAGSVAAIIEAFTDGSLSSLMVAFGVMTSRHHERLTNAEVWDAFDADLAGIQGAVYSLLGKTLPEADPKEPSAEVAPTETPTEETVPVGT